MLNDSHKFVVYLDPETLHYLYLNYTGKRSYPVMSKLYAMLKEFFESGATVVPLTNDHIVPYIEENKIDGAFLEMMGGIGQLQFQQRFTIRILQVIRVINSFFSANYKKPIWKDAFSTDPDERLTRGFNTYCSLVRSHVMNAVDREKKHSPIIEFIDGYRSGAEAESLSAAHFGLLWEEFPDLFTPHLPVDGDPHDHMMKFLAVDEIKDIPEFHIISSILYPLFEAYGLETIETGLKDDILIAAESMAAYMPYSHFYVTTVDIAELVLMSGINETYGVRLYDHNESSLYQVMKDLPEAVRIRQATMEREGKKTIFTRLRR